MNINEWIGNGDGTYVRNVQMHSMEPMFHSFFQVLLKFNGPVEKFATCGMTVTQAGVIRL
jgi:hypothetical protein